jgi:mannose-6-phosphate isomerase-like protein (cupin superfamily)
MDLFDLKDMVEGQQRSGRPYLEFLHVDSMSSGVLILKAGTLDTQTPHTEDELYFVIRGSASFKVGESQHKVAAGALIFVPAEEPHRFLDIEEDLEVLVFFAPAVRHNGP